MYGGGEVGKWLERLRLETAKFFRRTGAPQSPATYMRTNQIVSKPSPGAVASMYLLAAADEVYVGV